jgi:thiol-disulfide isomerase/thioredoxin
MHWAKRSAIFCCLAASAFAGDLLGTARALVETDPARALEYCRQVAGPEAWPVMLEADVKLQSWAAAERVGEAVIGEIESGRLFPRISDVNDEARARRWYAEALDRAGKPHQAREQRCMSGQILQQEPGDSACTAKASDERAQRIALLKAELLATELKQRGSPLNALEGHPGKVVVAAFWASWCAPCMKELEQLGRYHHPGAVVVPVDIDHLDFDTKRAYVPLESLEGPEVPQLYVLDAEGAIRFHLRGFDDDGFLTSKLDWMIEAVSHR